MVRNIKVRLLQIGKSQVWLLKELRNRGYKTLYAPRLSAIINGLYNTESSEEILNEAEKIIAKFE